MSFICMATKESYSKSILKLIKNNNYNKFFVIWFAFIIIIIFYYS